MAYYLLRETGELQRVQRESVSAQTMEKNPAFSWSSAARPFPKFDPEKRGNSTSFIFREENEGVGAKKENRKEKGKDK